MASWTWEIEQDTSRAKADMKFQYMNEHPCKKKKEKGKKERRTKFVPMKSFPPSELGRG